MLFEKCQTISMGILARHRKYLELFLNDYNIYYWKKLIENENIRTRQKKLPILTLSSNKIHRCPRLKIQGRGHLRFLSKSLGCGSMFFGKHCQGGPLFGCCCILVNKFYEDLPGGPIVYPNPPLTPLLCIYGRCSHYQNNFAVLVLIILFYSCNFSFTGNLGDCNEWLLSKN
jgi:hypothetical protein